MMPTKTQRNQYMSSFFRKDKKVELTNDKNDEF